MESPFITAVIQVIPVTFREIPDLFGAPDYALLGIGAYKPRWFMRPNHISPYESLTAAEEMHAGLTIPMHYGTFDLSDEPLHDPRKSFATEAKRTEDSGEDSLFGRDCEIE